jgi:hypothetical protein
VWVGLRPFCFIGLCCFSGGLCLSFRQAFISYSQGTLTTICIIICSTLIVYIVAVQWNSYCNDLTKLIISHSVSPVLAPVVAWWIEIILMRDGDWIRNVFVNTSCFFCKQGSCVQFNQFLKWIVFRLEMLTAVTMKLLEITLHSPLKVHGLFGGTSHLPHNRPGEKQTRNWRQAEEDGFMFLQNARRLPVDHCYTSEDRTFNSCCVLMYELCW